MYYALTHDEIIIAEFNGQGKCLILILGMAMEPGAHDSLRLHTAARTYPASDACAFFNLISFVCEPHAAFKFPACRVNFHKIPASAIDNPQCI